MWQRQWCLGASTRPRILTVPPRVLCIPDCRVSAFRTQWSETNCRNCGECFDRFRRFYAPPEMQSYIIIADSLIEEEGRQIDEARASFHDGTSAVGDWPMMPRSLPMAGRFASGIRKAAHLPLWAALSMMKRPAFPSSKATKTAPA